MSQSKGRRISSLTEAKEIPLESNFPLDLPNEGNSRRATMETIVKAVSENLDYATDEDIDAIIDGTFDEDQTGGTTEVEDPADVPEGGTDEGSDDTVTE